MLSVQGKNNGSLQGEVYFVCAENHGVFVKQTQVVPLNEPKCVVWACAWAGVFLPSLPLITLPRSLCLA
jgi:hypothetical protein